MSSEERIKAEPCAGTFNGCLVDGDEAENARERKTKRRSVVISIVVQTAGLAALVIAPLLAKPAVMAERFAVPIPPYRSAPAPKRTDTAPPFQRPAHPRIANKRCSSRKYLFIGGLHMGMRARDRGEFSVQKSPQRNFLAGGFRMHIHKN